MRHSYILLIAILTSISACSIDEPESQVSGQTHQSRALVFDQQFSETKLIASDGSGIAFFGLAAAISGDSVIVGAPADNSETGAGYFYRYDESGIFQESKLVPSFGIEADDRFGDAVAVHQETIVFGAPRDDEKGLNSGSVYVYTPGEAGGFFLDKILATDGALGHAFGLSVAIDLDLIVVGAPSNNTVYVYTPAPSGGYAETKITVPDSPRNFGWDVAVSGNSVLVGAPRDDLGGNDRGSVYLFELDGSGGYTTSKLIASDGSDQDLFGWSVSIDSEALVIGAPGENNSSTSAGAAYIILRNADGSFTEKKITADDADPGDRFGLSVAKSGDTVLVGAPYEESIGTLPNAGAVYVFKPNASFGYMQSKITAQEPVPAASYGYSVAIEGDTIVVGAPFEDRDSALQRTGAAYVYKPEVVVNRPPVANAGFDLFASLDSVVTLNGSGNDPDGDPIINYRWELISEPSGSSVTLTNPLSMSPSFTTEGVGEYVFELVVSDGLLNSEPDFVSVRTDTYSIAGHITNASGDPVSEVYVCARRMGFSEVCYASDFSGAYQILGLQNGEYEVGFNHDLSVFNYIPEWYDDAIDVSEATPVFISGSDVLNINAVLAKSDLSLSGSITDLTGRPLAGITACVYKDGIEHSCRFTNGEGLYQITDLQDGEYRLLFNEGSFDFRYMQEWYDNASDSSSATPVILAGRDVTGLDAQLVTLSPSITGTVSDPTGMAISDISVCATSSTGIETCVVSDRVGIYEIADLENGNYSVSFNADISNPFFSAKWYDDATDVTDATVVVLLDSDISGIDAVLSPVDLSISGVVTDDFGNTLNGVSVCAHRVGGAETCFFTDFDGTYSVLGLGRGDYLVEFNDEAGLFNFATEWYDNVAARTEATVISLSSSNVTSINAALDSLVPPGELLDDEITVLLEDGELLIDVLANDRDPSTNLIDSTLSLLDPAIIGSAITIVSEGASVFSYTPAASGVDSFTYLICDDTGACASAGVTVNVLDSTDCTLSGTMGADRLIGTNRADVICGFGGDDVIRGLGGRDVIFGGSGNDRILGGKGRDEIYGGRGIDDLRGGNGRDIVVGGRGNDQIRGGAGADKLSGGSGEDVVRGGGNADVIYGGSGNDELHGGAGRDTGDGGAGFNRCINVEVTRDCVI